MSSALHAKVRLDMQIILEALISDAFTGASGNAVMPALRIMVIKHPLHASNLVLEAPMLSCGHFYMSSVSEQELTPMFVEAGSTLTPHSIEACSKKTRVFSTLCWCSSWLLASSV
jgi:hypothetical protein